MANANPNKFRLALANDLRIVATALRDLGVCDDVGPLQQAAAECGHNTPLGKRSWGYTLPDLRFRLGILDVTSEKTLVDATLTLSVSARGYTDVRFPYDPFESLELNIVVTAYERPAGEHEGSGSVFTSCWHLDRHIGTPDDEPRHGVHPLYHMQFGGARIQPIRDHLGLLLLLNPPRLLHPPMEALLAIDFVLAHFDIPKWRAVREDPSYENRILNAYTRYWTPYFGALAERAANHDVQAIRNLYAPLTTQNVP